VKTIEAKKVTGIKRVNINLEISLHNAFKSAAAANGTDMTVLLKAFIETYVAKNGPKALVKKSRRA
jgi:hypothetical protein